MDLQGIRTTLGDAGISSAVTHGAEGAGYVHVPATAEEWIAVTPSDDQDELWHVALYGPGAPVASELHRLRAGEWAPREGIEIIRGHLAERGLWGVHVFEDGESEARFTRALRRAGERRRRFALGRVE